MNKPRCENCKFYQSPEAMQGQCLANPPTVIMIMSSLGTPQFMSTWPNVKKDHWCGKFEEKPSSIELSN